MVPLIRFSFILIFIRLLFIISLLAYSFAAVDTHLATAEQDAPAMAEHQAIIMMLTSPMTVLIHNGQQHVAKPFDDHDPAMYPYEEHGTTMVPLRFFAQHFGASVTYLNTDAILIDWDQQRLQFAINSSVFIQNQSKITMPAPAKLRGDSTYVPLRTVSEAVYKQVVYHDHVIYVGDPTDEDAALLLMEQNRTALQSAVKTQTSPTVWDHPTLQSVYITFDDGPNQHTPLILDILKKYDINATFFMLAPQIDQYPGTVRRIIDEGHSIGLHGVTHNKNLIYRTPQTVIDEMDTANISLKKAVGVTSTAIRVPYGSKPYMKEDYRKAVVHAGYHMWDWNIDSTDSLGSDANTILKKTIDQLSANKNPAVILFHDKATTAQILPAVIEWLIDHHYKFLTIHDETKPINFWGNMD